MSDIPAPSRPAEPEPIEAIVCVGPGPVGVALAALEGLRMFTGVSRIEVIAAADAVSPLRHALGAGDAISIRDEREVELGIDRAAIERHLADRGADPRRAGWYLQQFLKLAAAARPGASWRLVWDGDTLPLRPLRFLSDEVPPRPLLAPRVELHPPYFKAIDRLLGPGPLVSYSFIHEHLLMRQDLAARLIAELAGPREHRTAPWPMRVLEAIDDEDLFPSGFSEFETYGTFVHRLDPEAFAPRPLASTRDAMVRLGPRPSAAGLIALSSRFDVATFEARHLASRRGRWRQRLGLRAAGRMLDRWRFGVSRDRDPHAAVLASMAAAIARPAAPQE